MRLDEPTQAFSLRENLDKIVFYCRNQVQPQRNQRFDQPWTKARRQSSNNPGETYFVPKDNPHKSQSQLEFDYSRNKASLSLYEDETQGDPIPKIPWQTSSNER